MHKRVYGKYSWEIHCEKGRKAEFGRGNCVCLLRSQAILRGALEWRRAFRTVPHGGTVSLVSGKLNLIWSLILNFSC